MRYIDACRLSLHIYSVIDGFQLGRLYRYNSQIDLFSEDRKYDQNALIQIGQQQHLYYLYGDKSFTPESSQKSILSNSIHLAIKLCTKPENLVNDRLLTKINYDESICIQKHIHYHNPDPVVFTMLSYLGDDTVHDRYNYAQYLLQYKPKQAHRILNDLHRKYHEFGIKHLEHDGLLHLLKK